MDTWEDGQDDLTYHLDKQKHTADLLIPLSQKFSSLLLADINATKEKRIYSSKNSPLPSSNYTRFSNLSTLKLGLIYLPPKTPKETQYFVLLSRYGRFDFNEDIRPMVESIIGFDLSLQKYGIQLPKTHSNYGRLLTRVRNYAYGNEYLVIIEYRFKIGDSLALEISIPSHLKAEWLTKNKQWGVYLIASGSSYQYPLDYDEAQGWLKGATLQAYLGLRKHLISIFHVSAEGGAQMEQAEYYDEKKNLLRRHTTNPSPWLRLQLETYIP